MCYTHDKKQPVEEITIYPCEWYVLYDKTQLTTPSRTCDFDLLSGEMAWLDETKQQYSSGTVAESDLKGKRTEAYCRSIQSFN